MKVDLALWAKNGARYLPIVLKRIDEVIPEESVESKVFVDNASTDSTREIAKEFNWQVYVTQQYLGLQEAIHHVTSPYLVTFEQDVVLARDWWEKIPPQIEDEEVAVVQGIRISTHPILSAIEAPTDTKEGWARLRRQAKLRVPDYFWSIDNNIFRTDILRRLIVNQSLDLKDDYEDRTNYRWIVDPSVVSAHLRFSVQDYVVRERNRVVTGYRHSAKIEDYDAGRMVRLAATSPLRGLVLAVEKRNPLFIVDYPYIRFELLLGYLQWRRSRQLARFMA